MDNITTTTSLELPLDLMCAFGTIPLEDLTFNTWVSKNIIILGSTSLFGHGGGIVNTEH